MPGVRQAFGEPQLLLYTLLVQCWAHKTCLYECGVSSGWTKRQADKLVGRGVGGRWVDGREEGGECVDGWGNWQEDRWMGA